jgi:hypothetical protein
MVVNLGVDLVQPAFIQGFWVYDTDVMVPCYVHSDVDVEKPSQESFIYGDEPITSGQPLHLVGVTAVQGWAQCYVMSHSEEVLTYVRSYVGGMTPLEPTQGCYIYGVEAPTASQDAMIVALSTATGSVLSYIAAEAPYKAKKLVYMKGLDIATPSQLSYLVSELNDTVSIGLYMQGLAGAFRAVYLYIDGEALTSIVGSQSAHIVSDRDHATQHAFIVTDDPEHQDCYIVSIGPISAGKPAHVAG